MDKKALFELNVEKAVYIIADYMLENSENGIYIGRAESIRNALKINHYVYTEASGRLRALGFHNGVKHFTKSEMAKRNDSQVYYYKISRDNHPKIVLNTEQGKRVLKDRKLKLEQKREIELEIYMSDYSDIVKANNELDD
jgi:hypothetical protein